jgi:DNA-directed RNA polymerase subunit alpha
LEPVAELPISIAAAQALTAGGVFYVGDLIQRAESELVGLGVPSACVQEIQSALATRGLTIGNRLEDWPPAAKD